MSVMKNVAAGGSTAPQLVTAGTPNVRTIERLRAKYRHFAMNKALPIAGDVALRAIQRNTGHGVDYQERRFRQYTPRYKRIRERKGLRTDIVNLFVEGDLLHSLRFELDAKRLSPSPEQMKKAEGLQKKRKFMGVGKRTRKHMVAVVQGSAIRELKS